MNLESNLADRFNRDFHPFPYSSKPTLHLKTPPISDPKRRALIRFKLGRSACKLFQVRGFEIEEHTHEDAVASMPFILKN